LNKKFGVVELFFYRFLLIFFLLSSYKFLHNKSFYAYFIKWKPPPMSGGPWGRSRLCTGAGDGTAATKTAADSGSRSSGSRTATTDWVMLGPFLRKFI
jgi:hypothetical protein